MTLAVVWRSGPPNTGVIQSCWQRSLAEGYAREPVAGPDRDRILSFRGHCAVEAAPAGQLGRSLAVRVLLRSCALDSDKGYILLSQDKLQFKLKLFKQ